MKRPRDTEIASLTDFNAKHKNPFAALSLEENPEKANQPGPTPHDPKQGPTGSRRPPPIFIYGVEKRYALQQSINKFCKETPYVIHTGDAMKIHLRNVADYDKTLAFCQQAKYQHATERAKEDRPLKAVIRKLPIDTPPEAIKEALLSLSFPVTQVSQMHGTHPETKAKRPFPLFLISIQRAPGSAEIFTLDRLLHSRILIEPYKGKTIIQCFLCQRLGHTRHTCFSAARCVKCGLSHETSECPKTDKSTPAKCANCGGPHPANYQGCKIITMYKSKRQTQQTSGSSKQPTATPDGNIATPKQTPKTSETKITQGAAALPPSPSINRRGWEQSTSNNNQLQATLQPTCDATTNANAKEKSKKDKKEEEEEETVLPTQPPAQDTGLQALDTLITSLLPHITGINTDSLLEKFIAACKKLKSASSFMAQVKIAFDFLATAFDDGSE